MTDPETELRALVDYNDWADLRMFGALAGLDAERWTRAVGGSFGSIAATVAHLVGAEWIWLERWQGRSPTQRPDWLASTPEALEIRWRALARSRTEWLASLPVGSLDEDVRYTLLGGGDPQAGRLAWLIRHVVNHGSYHRGQITAFLRDVGVEPPSMDMLVWDRDGRVSPW